MGTDLLLCSTVAGKLHLKDALAAKSDININKTKSVKNVKRCRDSRSAINRETVGMIA